MTSFTNPANLLTGDQLSLRGGCRSGLGLYRADTETVVTQVPKNPTGYSWTQTGCARQSSERNPS